MIIKWNFRNDLITIFLILINCNFSKFSEAYSRVSFCDGKDLFVINDGDCSGGINFGSRKPDCVCISGVYRTWTKDCGLYDGFTHKYCSPLWEDGTSYNVQGLRLVPGVSNIYQDTLAVFGKNGSDFQSWQAFSMNTNGKTFSDTFYTLNGFPVVLLKPNEKFICVEPSQKKEKHVCRYFAKDNQDLWAEGEGMRIMLRENCNVTGYTMSELKEHRCYDIMDTKNSECQLSCGNGKAFHVPGSLSVGEKRFNETGGGDGISEEESMLPTSRNRSRSWRRVSNTNFFQHRKLNKYTHLRQVGRLDRPDMSQIAPNRTFTLLEICKRIVRSFCPRDFVSDLFLDQALELFTVLHRGQDFRYIEDVHSQDFLWIQDILLQCKTDRRSKRKYEAFLGVDKGTICEKDGYIGYYEVVDKGTIYQFKTERGDHHHKGKYHFVIDAVWLIVDLIHVLCYTSFVKSYRMFHVWEQASEKLLTRDIRNLWVDPQVHLTVYNALLSHRSLVDMVNLERCAEAAYKAHSRLRELVRPTSAKSHIKRRKRATYDKEHTSVAKSVDVFCSKKNEAVAYNNC